jgi:DNA-binding XRE family transcriptional regulator
MIALETNHVNFPAMLTGLQIKCGRIMLRWTAMELAEKAGVSYQVVQRCEVVDDVPRMRTQSMQAIQVALERGGIQFIEADATSGPGVRLRR